jgi:hypothetical protein
VSLQTEILQHVPADGRLLNALRAKVLDTAQALEAFGAALNGLRSAGRIHMVGTRVMPGPKPPLPAITDAVKLDKGKRAKPPKMTRAENLLRRKLRKRITDRNAREQREASRLGPDVTTDPRAARAHARAILDLERERLTMQQQAIRSIYGLSAKVIRIRCLDAARDSRRLQRKLKRAIAAADREITGLANAQDTEQRGAQ